MPALLDGAKNFGIGTIAGDKQHRNIRLIGAHPRKGLRTSQLGKNDVEDDKINFAEVQAEVFDGLFAIACQADLIAERGESGAGDFPKAIVILSKKNGFLAAAHALRRRGNGLNLILLRGYREKYFEQGSFTQFAFDVQVTAMLFDNAVDSGEAKPSAFAHSFCREKWLKYAFKVGRVDAGACVADGEPDVGARRRILVSGAHRLGDFERSSLELEFAAIGHGVTGIQAEIHDDLLDLRGINFDGRQVLRQQERQLDIAADDFAEQGDDIADDGVQIDVAGLENLASRKGEELAREGGGAVSLMLDFEKISLQLSIRRRVLSAQFDPAENGAKHVVEVVGDASGELADGLEFLRLTKLAFESELFRNVQGSDQEGRPALEIHFVGNDFDVNRAAIFGAMMPNSGVRRVVRFFCEIFAETVSLLGRSDVGGAQAKEFVTRITVLTKSGVVDFQVEKGGGIHDKHGDGIVGKEKTEVGGAVLGRPGMAGAFLMQCLLFEDRKST